MKILILSLIITLVITLIGFRRTVWFISIGYTASIVACSIFFLFYRHSDFKLFNYLQVLLLITWGGRLGYYIIKRESDSNYNSSVKDETDNSQQLSLIVKTGIWVSVSLLYVCMFSPAVFTLNVYAGSYLAMKITAYSGLLIMAAGVVIEAIADRQKSGFKKNNPKSFCNVGLYEWVRCPNYLGEILVWTGSYVCAVPFFGSWWQWLVSSIGLLCIVLIMMGSAKRLEKKQSFSYGKNSDFQKYERSVPILFPWIKLYSLQNIKVYLE